MSLKGFNLKKDDRFFLPVFLVVFLMVSIYSYCTSPFYHEPSAGDSAMFMVIGKYWTEGSLPYVGFWDSKGPIIFLANALGNFQILGVSGLFLIQLLCLSFSVYLMYKLLMKVFPKPEMAICASIVVVLSLGMVYNGGNNVEEYLLPFLMYAFYCLYKWTMKANDGSYEHPAKYAFIYGLIFAFSLWSRLTNAVGVGFAVLFILIVLIYKGLWKNLLWNALAFVGGFLLLSIPIVAYFYFNGILDELWYGTVLYNLDYASRSASPYFTFRDIAGIVGKYGNALLLLFTSIILLLFNTKNKLGALLWLFVSVGTLYWFVRGNGFGHYAIIALPYPFIAFIELFKLYKENRKSKAVSILTITFYCLLVLGGVLHGLRLINMYKDNQGLTEFRTVLKQLPPNYKESFLAYNCQPDIYIYEDIKPACRFFTMQDWEVKCSSTLKPKMIEALNESMPQWIVLRGSGSDLINTFLNKNYIVWNQPQGKYTIYQLKTK